VDLRAIFDLCVGGRSEDGGGGGDFGGGGLGVAQFREAILALRPGVDAQTTDDVFYSVIGLTGNDVVSWDDFQKVYEGQFDAVEFSAAAHNVRDTPGPASTSFSSSSAAPAPASAAPASASASTSLSNRSAQSAAAATPVITSREDSGAIVSELRRHVARLEGQLENEQQARGALSTELSDLRGQHSALEDRAEAIEKLKAQINGLQVQVEGGKQRISDERLSRTIAERETREAEAQREAAMDSCADLQQQLSNAITLLEQSNQDRERALSEKNTLQVKLKSEREALRESLRLNERAESRVKELQQELERVQLAHARSDRESKKHASASEFADKSLDEVQQKLKTVRTELSEEREARQTAERRHEAVDHENGSLRADILRAQEAARMAKLRAEDATNAMSKSEAKLFSSGKAIERLEEELARERQRVSSAPSPPLPSSLSDQAESMRPGTTGGSTATAYEHALLAENRAEIESLRTELEAAKRDGVLQREELSRQSTLADARNQDLQQQLDEIMGAYAHDQRNWASEKDAFRLGKADLEGQLESAKNNATSISDKADAARERIQTLEIEKQNVAEEMTRLKVKSERELTTARREQTDMQAEADAAATRLHKSITTLQTRVKECEKHAEQEKRVFAQNLRDAQVSLPGTPVQRL
jgi:chromosome segregation ATPase